MEWLQQIQQQIITMMLKAAQKRSQLTGTREFKTKRLIQGIGSQDTKRKSMYDIQAKLRSSVGIIRMNREHRFNTLTPGFVSQVARGVETMNLDHTVSLIYLTTAEGQHFCNGTDFRTMLHYQKSGKQEQVASYVEDIYKLQTIFAKTNKPIMSVAPGHSYNSGAGLLVASGFPAICHDSKLSFNEVTFGYVPHAGSTYYASRLPGDFGTFLLLTGWPITGKDAINLGLADSLIEIPETYEHEISDIVLAMDPSSMPYSRQIVGADNYGVNVAHPAEEAALKRARQINQQDVDDSAELRKRLGKYTHDEPFMDPRDRKPDVVAVADIAYKKMLKEYNIAKYGQGGQGFFEHGATTFNQFDYIHKYLRLHTGHIYSEDTVRTLLQHREMIDRCFWSNSVEEITESLKRESHPFAKEILQKMECNSMLSMKLALKMLRQSKNLGYGEILKMELNVALNKVGDSDFELGVKEVLMKPSKVSRLGLRPNPGFKSLVSDAEVDSYFAQNKYASGIDLDIVENSLLPTRHFFERFSDSVRVYINETSSPQEDIRDAVKLEIEECLRAEGIDIRDKTVTVPMAREYIDKKVRQEKQFAEMMRRSNQLISDKKLRQWYFNGINAELLKLEDKKGFYSIVNSNIHKIFEKAYFERLNLVYEKSKEAQSLQKRRMFIKMKKFLIKSRIMGYMNEETERLTKQVEALPFKMIHLTEKWDESYRNMEHPELRKSVMWHLSKVVGKANLAPPEMVKTFLTDPEAAKSMQVYTFDRIELQKLQTDLLSNPEKYEQMLNQEREQDDWLAGKDYGSYFEQKEKRALRQEYWYNVMNDGRLNTEENWPMRVEYYKYKQWADNIKNKAMDTLKYTVSRLLVDFENDEQVGNKTIEFSKDAKETKRNALERLMVQLNERVETKTVKKPAQKKQILNQFKRPIAQIEKDFNSMIDSDKDLSKLFGKSNVENVKIQKFRQGMLDELLQLVETALLEEADMSKDALEKRLAQITNPANIDKDNSASLNLIDSYLADKNGKLVLKEAVEFVKPFFFEVYQEKLNEETQKILEEFNVNESSMEALEHYLAYSLDPSAFKNSKFLPKLQNFHEEKIARENAEINYPLDSQRFANRHILDLLGVGSTFSSAKSPKDLIEATRNEQRDFSEYNRLRGLPEVEIDFELQSQRNKKLRVPYDDQENQDLISNPAFYHSLTQDEVDDLELLTHKIQEVKSFVQTHQHEITTTMSHTDWLDVYSKSIKEYDLDMDHLIRSTREPDQYHEDMEAGKLLKEDWKKMADYAQFISGVQKASGKKDNYEKLIQFMAKHDQDGDGVTRESIFRGVIKSQYQDQSANTRDDLMRNKINSISSLQQRISEQSQKGLECLRLANYAPKETRDMVQSMLQNKSKYIDYNQLAKYLAKRDYSSKFDPKMFIDQKLLLEDLHQGNALQDFLRKYKDIKLDVVSLAEIKELINGSFELSNVNNDMIAQIETVLEHVDEQMAYVSHQRRQQISLGEFLSRHHYMNSQSFRHYSSDLLKSQIETALGMGESKEQSSAVIDWELGNVLTQTEGQMAQDSETDIDSKLRDTAYGVDKRQGGSSFSLLDESTGLKSNESDMLKIVYQEARKATVLSPEMDSLRNLIENKLLQEYMKEKYDTKVIESYVFDYMNARIKDCSLKLDFAKSLKSPHGHIYLKTLRERIMDELNLDESTSPEQFQFQKIYDTVDVREYDAESKYNLNHLNNDQAIGFRNLEERAKDIENNKTIAHESVFDEMLADYFLQKRGDYQKGNKLMTDLEKIFDSKIGHEQGHPLKEAGNTLGFHYLSQSVGKDDAPDLIPHNFPALLELDVAVNRQLHNNKGGLSQTLRDMGDNNYLIPEYFDVHDVRKPADLYVKDKLQAILDELFTARRKLEKHLSRSELIAYDKVLSKYLTHDNLLGKLKREIYKDYNELEQLNQMANHERDAERSNEKQLRKVRNHQPEFNKGVVNEDAFYKQLAYSGLLEKKRRDNRKEVLEDPVLQAGFHTFENYYQDRLVEDAKLPARQIDPSVFTPKKRTKITGTSDRKDYGYLDMTGRRDLFLEEHAQYKENKLEQSERIDTFFILEQFFEKQRKNPVDESNPLFQAQEHIREYFSEPENTYFFDKNKIH